MSAEEIYKWIGARIRVAREQAGLTQADLAKALGQYRTSITNIEAGKQRLLVHRLADLARVLDIDMAALLGQPTEAERESLENTVTAHARLRALSHEAATLRASLRLQSRKLRGSRGPERR